MEPGTSGFTGSFYKVNWGILKHLILHVVHKIQIDKCLPQSQLYGIIDVIPKAKKDLLHIKNLRPPTLLNSLYKLFSAVLASRLKFVLAKVLSISEVTRNTYNLFLRAMKYKKPGIGLMIDFEKSFESVSFSFINNSLNIFGFDPFLKSWVNILCGNSNVNGFNGVTIVNGHISEKFCIQRGCKQGDPISGYFLVLCIENLILLIKNSEAKLYYLKDGTLIPYDEYVDDLTIYLKYLRYDQDQNTINVAEVKAKKKYIF